MKNVVYLLIFAAFFVSCKSSTQKVEAVSDPCLENQIEVARLQERVLCLEEQNADLLARLNECLGKEEVVVKKPATTSSKPTIKKITTTPAPKKVETAPAPAKEVTTKSAPVARSVTPGKANLDYLRQGGEILFCVRANNREDLYFPHYAMMHGVQFNQPLIDNQVKGYNWKVEPTDFYDGDYGVTVDGTFYVSNELIEKTLRAGGLQPEGILEIKAPFTGWALKSMRLEDGFWVYKTQ